MNTPQIILLGCALLAALLFLFVLAFLAWSWRQSVLMRRRMRQQKAEMAERSRARAADHRFVELARRPVGARKPSGLDGGR